MISLSPTAPPGVLTGDGLAADLCCFPTREQYHDLVASFRADGFDGVLLACFPELLESR